MDIRNILGKLDQLNEGTMAQAKAKPTGPKFGKGKWKGTDPASAAKDKYVGGESILRDLEAKLNEDPVKRDLSKEFRAFKEAYDHNAPFNAADFNRHMEQLRAREELRKTDPMRALVGDLIDKDNAARNVKKKPQDDDSMSTSDPRHPQYAYTQAGQQDVTEAPRKPRKPAAPQFTKYTNYELWERERYARGANYSETEIDGRLVGVAVVGTTYNEWGYVRDTGKVVGMWYNKASIGSFVQDGTSFDDSLSYAEQDTNWPYMDESQGVAEDVDAHWIPDVVALLGKLVASSKAQAKYNVEPADIPDVKEFINLLSAGDLDAARDHWSMMEWNDLDNALEYFVRKNGLPHVWLHKLLGEQGVAEGFSDLELAVMEGGHELVNEAPVAPVAPAAPGTAPAPVAGKPTLGADLTKPAAQQDAQQQQQDQKAQQAAAQKEKQEQATLTKGVNALKSAGAAVSNPNQVVKAFDKAEDNAGLTPADKNSIASAGTVLAPIMANPQLQGKFKDLVTQASAAQKKEQQQQANQPQPAVGAPVAGQVK